MTNESQRRGAIPGEELLKVLAALASPHRLRILGLLVGQRIHVSELARQVGLSRPLVHMHLRKLEDAGLLAGQLELSEGGRAMKYYEVAPFAITLDPRIIADAAQTLDRGGASDAGG